MHKYIVKTYQKSRRGERIDLCKMEKLNREKFWVKKKVSSWAKSRVFSNVKQLAELESEEKNKKKLTLSWDSHWKVSMYPKNPFFSGTEQYRTKPSTAIDSASDFLSDWNFWGQYLDPISRSREKNFLWKHRKWRPIWSFGPGPWKIFFWTEMGHYFAEIRDISTFEIPIW